MDSLPVDVTFDVFSLLFSVAFVCLDDVNDAAFHSSHVDDDALLVDHALFSLPASWASSEEVQVVPGVFGLSLLVGDDV